MYPFFICNQDQVEAKLKNLTKTGSSKNGCTHYYRDDKTNEEWLFNTYDSEFEIGGIPVLKRIPEPTIDELINIALTSVDRNEVLGASIELSQRERYHKEDFRQKLLNRLLQFDISNLTGFEKERLKLVIYESNLYDSTNRREIVGKHFMEILKDADYYHTASQKAKNILAKI